MNCPEPQIISAFVDGELEAVNAAEVQQHVVECPNCRRFLEEMEQVDSCGRSALRAVPAAAFPLKEVPGKNIVRLRIAWHSRMRPALLALAALVVAGVAVWIWMIASQSGNSLRKPAPAIVFNQNARSDFADSAFERWAAQYRQLGIQRVPLDVAARYEPPPIAPIQFR